MQKKVPRLVPRRPRLDWRLRLGVVSGLILLAMAAGYMVYWEAPTPTTTLMRPFPLWKWDHQGEWDYTVHLKPNTLFDGLREMGSGLTYFEALIDRIEARFSYVFNSDQPARIEGTYHVTGDIADTAGLWTKSFTVIPETPFLVEDGDTYSVELAILVDRGFFRERLAEINEETGVSGGATFAYTAHVSVAAQTNPRKGQRPCGAYP